MNPARAMQYLLTDVCAFSEHAGGVRLRAYQRPVAQAIVRSVLQGLGYRFVVIFPRQSGKNELQAQIEAYLLTRLMLRGGEMVQVSPTWKPQSLNAMYRLERALQDNHLVQTAWRKEHGYIYRLGRARVVFLSGHREANIVGATASTLLCIDEAQDISAEKYDKEIAPMAASTNATTVFWGTAWTSETLLARERRAAQAEQANDGVRRVFVLDAEAVAREVPAYGDFVAKQVRALGRQHPLVRTQFFSEEIDASGGMFPSQRIALMQGTHPPLDGPRAGRDYCLLIDVAGADEKASDPLSQPEASQRDSTAVTVVEVLPPAEDDLLAVGATYRVVQRHEWLNVRHSRLYGELRALVEHWRARYVVIDATGVGAGLASFLGKAFPQRVVPFTFTAQSKSDLGWDFLAVIETGRYKEYRVTGEQTVPGKLQERFWRQVRACEHRATDSAGRGLRWGVPDGRRDPQSGERLHDDLLISAALCAVLDQFDWSASGESRLIERRDPLEEIDRGGF